MIKIDVVAPPVFAGGLEKVIAVAQKEQHHDA